MRLDRRLLALLAVLCLVAVACAGTAPEETEPASDVHVYEVRGQVTAVPDPADPLSNLRVRHEAIPHFVSIDGEVVGMDSMNMPFPVAEGLDLSGIAVGDKVHMTFEVEWEGDVPYQATQLEKLPEDAELDFGSP
jgi:hypothetical protein